MQAYDNNLVVKTVEMPEEKQIMTPDGTHPWAVEVVSVGDSVNKYGAVMAFILWVLSFFIDRPSSKRISEGDLVCAAGNQQEFISDHYLIHKSQVKAIVEEDEL